MTTTNLLLQLFEEVDTPDLREIVSEDVWIRRQRDIYNRIRRKLDCDAPLEVLYERAVEDEVAKMEKEAKP